jgi:hypothetical protein
VKPTLTIQGQDRNAATAADGEAARAGAPVGCFDELIDGIAGVTLTALSSLPARCAPRGDLAIRRSIERVVFEVRTEIANVCQQMADKCGEPPLDEQVCRPGCIMWMKDNGSGQSTGHRHDRLPFLSSRGIRASASKRALRLRPNTQITMPMNAATRIRR